MSARLRRNEVRRNASRYFLLVVIPLIASGCFSAPIPELWPPKPGEPRHWIDVICHGWHTMIVIPCDAPPPSLRTWREWEYCEKAWYLDGSQGIPGAFRSLCWPTQSGVGDRRMSAPPWRRWPQEEIQRWSYVLSEKGYRAMLEWLEAQRGAPLAEYPGWYRGVPSYHFFFHCRHFTAAALRAAGLPISPWWAFSPWLVGIQFDRIRRYHEEAGLSPSTPGPAGSAHPALRSESRCLGGS